MFHIDIIKILCKGVPGMFICSFKLNKNRLLSGIAGLCIALTLLFLILPGDGEETNAVGAAGAKDQQQMVDFLAEIGYTVVPQAVLIENVTIPETFDDKYTEYNELQKQAGMDLTGYAGIGVTKYTFRVLDYKDAETEVVANLLVSDSKIIGGDISSTALGGFCEPLKKRESETPEEKPEQQEQEASNE